MEMNALGIKIVRNLKGFTSLFEYNATPVLSNSIDDIRDLLMSVDNLTGNTVAIMLTNHKEGSIITLATWLAGIRGDESISAWIYVPNNIKITGDELASIIETTKSELISEQRNDYRLTEVFSKRYEVDPIARPVYISAGQTYACRYYGQDGISLSSILDNLYQPYYSDYKQIFLLDANAGHRFEAAYNLTGMKVLSRCLLVAPEAVEGFNAFIDNEQFRGGKYYNEGDYVVIDWMRKGFQTIRVRFKAVVGMKCVAPPRGEMKFVCTYNHIAVRNESGEPVSNCNIMVNKFALMPNGSVLIHLDHISKTTIDITATGYEDYSAVHDFFKGKPVITLTRGVLTYWFLFPTKNSYIRTEFKSDRELIKSPFKGYTLEHKPQPNADNRLKYSAFTSALKIRITIWAVFLLIVGVAGGWFAATYYNENVAPLDEISEFSSTEVSDTTAAGDTTVLEKAESNATPDNNKVKKSEKPGEKTEESGEKTEKSGEKAANDNTEEQKK